jgi:hypothetical protein
MKKNMLGKDIYSPLVEQEHFHQSGKPLSPSDRRNQDRIRKSRKIANVPLSPKPHISIVEMGSLRGSFVSGSVLVSAKQNSGKQSITDASPKYLYFTAVKSTNKSNLQITKTLMLELLQEEEEDDYGILRPTSYAFNNTWNLLENVSKILETEFPKAWASTDENGGIRLTWSNVESNAGISLMCGASPEDQTYIYHEHGDIYGVVKEVSVFSLAYWIKWLNQV